MKRNRLVKSANQNNIFSANKNPLSNRRRFLPFSLIGFTGIFITTIVLATSQPDSPKEKSQIVDLPGLPASLQTPSTDSLSIDTTSNKITLNLATDKIPNTNTNETLQLAPSISPEKPTTLELALIEQNAIDSHANTTLESNITVETEALKPELQWHDVIVKSGDNLSKIFPRIGLTARDVYNIAQLGDEIKPLLNLKPGQVIKFGLTDESKLAQLDLILSPIETLTISNNETGYDIQTTTRTVDVHKINTAGIIESSLFEAGIEAGLSNKLVMELAYIFGWDIDFALDLRKGDQFKVIYEEEFLDGEKIADGAILAAEFVNQGNVFQAIRFTNDDGTSRYFSPSGDSMRKAFSRTPVHFSRISSRFSYSRKHPKLKGVTRPHRGVDYAAATGTPILATGDGKVDFVGTKGGYGRTVVLSHGGKYTTLYAHMSRYKKGMKRGKRVKQGDVIGYIGMSGTATGPHLHYEFRVDGIHRNPLTVALPKAEPLNKKYLVDFNQQAMPLLAQLDTINSTLALNN
jgi:murein DD-endopeptidase MepM/ murein hydrolase activator NlpD